MTDFLGRFLWYEFLAADPAGAQTFYKKVVGWGVEAWPSPDMKYDLWTRKGGVAVGGLMELPEEARKAGVPPHWLSYVGTPSVDKTLAKAKGLGASVLMGPMDVPNVGRMVVLQDPQGAAFALYQPQDAPAAEAPPQAGEFSWHELATSDPEAAWRFYSALFGWVKTTAMDMGPLGVYQMFGRTRDVPLGGIYRAPAEMPGPSNWLPYAMVPDVNAATKQLKTSGGTVINGPMQVPGGDWIVMGLDPQGAAFALHQRAKAAPKKKPTPKKKVVARKKVAAKKKPAARKRVAPRKQAAKRKAPKRAPKRKATRRRR